MRCGRGEDEDCANASSRSAGKAAVSPSDARRLVMILRRSRAVMSSPSSVRPPDSTATLRCRIFLARTRSLIRHREAAVFPCAELEIVRRMAGRIRLQVCNERLGGVFVFGDVLREVKLPEIQEPWGAADDFEHLLRAALARTVVHHRNP